MKKLGDREIRRWAERERCGLEEEQELQSLVSNYSREKIIHPEPS